MILQNPGKKLVNRKPTVHFSVKVIRKKKRDSDTKG